MFSCGNEIAVRRIWWKDTAGRWRRPRLGHVAADRDQVFWNLHFSGRLLYICIQKKVKWSRYRPGVAQRVGRGIALLFHDRGTRSGWVVSSTLRPHFTPRERPGTHCTGGWVGPRAGLDGRKISFPPGFFLMHLLTLTHSCHFMYKCSDLSCYITICQVGVFLWYRHAHKTSGSGGIRIHALSDVWSPLPPQTPSAWSSGCSIKMIYCAPAAWPIPIRRLLLNQTCCWIPTNVPAERLT